MLAGVSRASYYRQWAQSAPRQEETAVRDVVQRAALANRRYGYRRITAQLAREGFVVNHKRVLRLMQQDNLLVLRSRPFVPVTTDSRSRVAVVPNLARGLVPTGLDQLWVADITYVRLFEEFAFLAVVLDAFSRRVIGWALDNHLRASLAIDGARDGNQNASSRPCKCDPSFGSWRAVCLPGVHAGACGARHSGKHESDRQSLRQCQGGEFHEDTQTRGGRRPELSRSQRRPRGDRRLHRRRLQSTTTALGSGLLPTSRVRGKPAATWVLSTILSTGRPANRKCNQLLISVSQARGAVQVSPAEKTAKIQRRRSLRLAFSSPQPTARIGESNPT